MTESTEFYSKLAQAIQWYKDTNEEYKGIAEDKIKELEKRLPYGSGFDAGSSVDMKKSTGQKIVIDTAFHHLDENGYYDGWTEHKVIITPCLMYGYNIKVTGRNRNQIKEYIYDQFTNVRI
jgi:hypothetical protein